mmetsp:Transcript_17192/g.51383  ORF Transcript_17192/g.51383 Transcript_17192/m.51383 type:complete len:463 (+) Transcript_17192:70-1458(+)|eukprot:CAMPEP_0177650614 /NCGR_PEP_ID=MMETSP0447-20121125/12044_1 /TAXON_ID=0 /ORGANISM="Stygamoeba regulata, Strain BSH-02190019" /LENGTH=462 /DNA_ID=CAMNT_0019153511 /DNA_START=33 /DNA_END=1421 /DNA_ORIENTATION=+
MAPQGRNQTPHVNPNIVLDEQLPLSQQSALQPLDPNLWYIHNKAYDLSSFVDSHPGGRNALLETRGQNVTEMFESVHALSKRDVHSMLSKYEVVGAYAADCPFTFAEGGAYHEITRRVSMVFAGQSYKATTWYYVQLLGMIAVYAAGMYFSIVHTLPLVALLTGGWLMTIFFYGALHDASHSALSKHAWINTFWSILSCHWGLWHSNIWFQHHCYGHHSYTGVSEIEGRNQRDPDLRWTRLLRKHPWFKLNPLHRFQQFFVHLMLCNQYLLQVQRYQVGRKSGRVFSLQLNSYSNRATWEAIFSYTIEIASVLVHFALPFCFGSWSMVLFSISLYWLGAGIMYFLIVAPNHDTQETEKSLDTPRGMDWGEMQIRHSSNFARDSSFLTMFFGGMNFQIEHHLFPTVCNIHYPAISKIVRAVCKERGLPYNYHPSLLLAHWSVWKNYRDLGDPKGGSSLRIKTD